MKVDIIGTAAEVTPQRVEGCAAAVIDVFRATSVMVTALAAGAARIIPITGVEETFAMRDTILKANPTAQVLLGGERHTEIIEGFDLDNSPLKYTREKVTGATILMSTTNGTRAVNCTAAAEQIYIAALLNADAVSRKLGQSGLDVVLVCSGRANRFTIEDGLCAGMMACYLRDNFGATLTDMAWVVADMYDRWHDDLAGALDNCEHYHRIKNRWGDDIVWCLERNKIDLTPQVTKNGALEIL